MNILFITHHWENNSHHSNYSGYQRLVYFISKEHEVSVLTWGKKDYEYCINNIKVLVRKTPKKDQFYQRRLLLSWYAHKIENNYDIIHALYCELGLLIKNNKKLITTVHVHPCIVRSKKFIPDLWLKIRWMLIDRRVISKASYNIAVSTNLIAAIKNNKINNLDFIPHGIDTLFWNNKNVTENKNRSDNGNKFKLNVLVVGLHGVNLKHLKNIIQNIKEINFIIVSSNFDMIADNVSIKSNVSDEELRALYEYADVLFRPLDFATANNSVLESISMGTPVITNNIKGITDYLSVANSFLANNEEEFFKIFKSLIKNKSLISDKSKNLTLLAQKYSWNNIAPKIELIYENVLKN